MNNTWNFIVYGGLSGGPDGGGTAGSAAVLDTPVTTPDGTTRHIDTSSVDVYLYAHSPIHAGMAASNIAGVSHVRFAEG